MNFKEFFKKHYFGEINKSNSGIILKLFISSFICIIACLLLFTSLVKVEHSNLNTIGCDVNDFYLESKKLHTKGSIVFYSEKALSKDNTICKHGEMLFMNPVNGKMFREPFKLEYEIVK